jgi:hypothetical protein
MWRAEEELDRSKQLSVHADLYSRRMSILSARNMFPRLRNRSSADSGNAQSSRRARFLMLHHAHAVHWRPRTATACCSIAFLSLPHVELAGSSARAGTGADPEHRHGGASSEELVERSMALYGSLSSALEHSSSLRGLSLLQLNACTHLDGLVGGDLEVRHGRVAVALDEVVRRDQRALSRQLEPAPEL